MIKFKQKFFAAFIICTMIFGGVSPVLAVGADITIITGGGTTSTTGKTYSAGNYVGIDGTVSPGSEVNSIKTQTGGVSSDVYGIKYGDAGTLSVDSLAGGIELTGTLEVSGIMILNSATTTVSNLGSITAKTGSTSKAKVIRGICTKDSANTTVTFSDTSAFIKATTASTNTASAAYGISAVGSGTTTVENLADNGNIKSITAESKAGIAYGVFTASGVTEVTFKKDTEGGISAKSTGNDAYGIKTTGSGTTTVGKIVDSDNLGISSITAEGKSKAYGIYSANTKTEVTFTTASAGSINAKSETGKAYGIYVTNSSEAKVNNLASIMATSTSGTAYSVYADGGTLTLNNIASITGQMFANSSGTLVTLDSTATTITGNVTAQDGGTIKLKNSTVAGNITEAASVSTYGTVKFIGANTVDGAVTLNHDQNVASVADSFSLTQIGTETTDVITINGGLSALGIGSCISIAGTVAAKATITGNATIGEGATISLSNAIINEVTSSGTLNLNKGATINGATTLKSGAVLNVAAESEATITNTLELKGAKINVDEGGILKVNNDVTIAEATQNYIAGTVKGDKLVNKGTLTANASDLQFDSIENNSMNSLILTGGEIQADIKAKSGATGSVTIKDKVISCGKNFENQVITVNSGAEFYFGGGKTTTISGERGGGLIAQNATLAFCLDGFKAGETILDSSTHPVNLTDVKVTLWQEYKPLLTEGDKLTLIKGANNYATQELKTLHEGQGIQTYKYNTFLDSASLMAEYLGLAGAAEESKSLSEGFIAGSVALMQAGDLASGEAIASAQTAADSSAGNSVVPYATVQGGHGRYHTGSHVDINSVQIAAGIAKKFSDSTLGGLLIEGGNGRYTSYNEFTSGELRADGEVKYYGVGIFAKHAFSKSKIGNAYLDASFGVGRTNQDYRTNDIAGIKDYHYDIGVIYLKAHATAGYEWHLGKASLDGYLKYLWACQNGATINFNGQDVNFDTINSHRVRVGARYTQKMLESLAWYGGLAYEYEFDASAGANSNGLAMAEPDLKGASGMAEIGLKYSPIKANNWLFDLGLEAFMGKKDSLSLRLGASYTF